MIRSMTGWGEAERPIDGGRLRAEIKTVNHRFFNAQLRTPWGFDRWENPIQGWLKEILPRGHVSLSLTLERDDGNSGPPLPEVDLPRARRYLELLEEIKTELGIPGEISLSSISRFGDVFRTPEEERRTPVEVEEEELRALIEEAARAAREMREVEGVRLRDDLEGRLEAMAVELDRVEARAPERLAAERDRLRAAVAELTEKDDVDEDRLAREIAYLAEKWDINEEIVRFRAHLEHFRETVEEGSGEPVGKKLSFLVQEMHREANTIGSKANDAEISRAAVALKEEIERLREQVENVE